MSAASQMQEISKPLKKKKKHLYDVWDYVYDIS